MARVLGWLNAVSSECCTGAVSGQTPHRIATQNFSDRPWVALSLDG